MRKNKALLFVLAGALAALPACGGGTTQIGPAGHGQPAGQPSAVPSTDPIVQNAGDGIIVGPGWFPVETFKGATFRWATNDAELTACPDANDRTLAVQLEPGPGIDGSNVPTAQITITGNHGDKAAASVKGRQYLKVTIGDAFPAESFVIHAITQNRSSRNGDKRILNYRILSAALGSSMAQCKREIVKDGSPIELGANWYAYETFAGQSYRWVTNDAQLKLTAAQEKPFVLELVVSPGPSLGEPLKLSVSDGRGHTVAQAPVAAVAGYPMAASFSLPKEPAGTVLTISAPSKQIPVTSDRRRYLNFRVFDAKVRS